MNEVIIKARELGQAILASDVYQALQLAEDEAQRDPAAARLTQRMAELKAQVREAYAVGDEESAQALSAELDETQRLTAELPSLAAQAQARQAFSTLMEQVNNVLEFTITGTINRGGCSGNCGGCKGCG